MSLLTGLQALSVAVVGVAITLTGFVLLSVINLVTATSVFVAGSTILTWTWEKFSVPELNRAIGRNSKSNIKGHHALFRTSLPNSRCDVNRAALPVPADGKLVRIVVTPLRCAAGVILVFLLLRLFGRLVFRYLVIVCLL